MCIVLLVHAHQPRWSMFSLMGSFFEWSIYCVSVCYSICWQVIDNEHFLLFVSGSISEVFLKLIHIFLLQQVYFEGWMTTEHWHSDGFRLPIQCSAYNINKCKKKKKKKKTEQEKKKKTFCARAIQSWHSLLINCAALGAENMSSNWIWNYVPQYCPSVKKIKKSLLIVAYNQ